MNMILAVFRSRAQALDCVSLLKKNGVSAGAVSTPAEANVGCGISVRIGTFDLPRARQILSRGNYSAFVGYYRTETKYGRTFVSRV